MFDNEKNGYWENGSGAGNQSADQDGYVRPESQSADQGGYVRPESQSTDQGGYVPVSYTHLTRRDDVSQIYYKQVYDRDYGFDIRFPYTRGADYWLLIRCDGKTARIKFNEELIAKRASVAHKRMEKIRDLMNMETVRVAVDFGKKHGLKACLLYTSSKKKKPGGYGRITPLVSTVQTLSLVSVTSL